jgi:putative ribosome biogenesis GTPase RsgA
MDKIEQLLDAEADVQAQIEEMMEERADEANTQMLGLLLSVSDRDPDVYDRYTADSALAMSDYAAVPVLQRGLQWRDDVAAQFVAAKMQTWLEQYGLPLLEMIEGNGRTIDDIRKSMTKEQLIAAGRKGVGKDRYNGAKERRRSSQG